MQKLIEKKLKSKLSDLSISASYICTRFAQANCFGNILTEEIKIDLEHIKKDIERFRKIGELTMEYIASEYIDQVSDSTTIEYFQSIVNICDKYLETMYRILKAAKLQTKDPKDQMVIDKSDLTLENGRNFINALKDLRAQAQDRIDNI